MTGREISMADRRYYIAYGSNLNIGQMKRRCSGAVISGTAVIDDYRLLFRGSGSGAYLTIEPDAASKVPVAVWSVTAEDEAMLDMYEGCPDFYYKEMMSLVVTAKSGRKHVMSAFVYIMHEDRPFGVPSRLYIETCAEGYRDFGFDVRALADAYKFSREEAKCRIK